MFFAAAKSYIRYLFTIHILRAKRVTRFCEAGSYYLLLPKKFLGGEKSEEWRGKKISSEQFRGIFLCYLDKIDATLKKSIKSRGVQLLKRFHVHPK
jgi:hypothetical protein